MARAWTIHGPLPREHGWYAFELAGRKARVGDPAEPPDGVLTDVVRGYLVGDRMVPEGSTAAPDMRQLTELCERVHLVEPGLDRFVRVRAGRSHHGGPLIYDGLEMPFGPEDEVLRAFLDGAESVADVPGVVPALDAAFRVESRQRAEARRRRLDRERRQREAEERLRLEQQRREIVARLGDGATRRRLAAHDFEEAARAALAVGGAELLDCRASCHRDEMVVRFRLYGRRFECTCQQRSLRIIDAGICLTDERTGRKDDDLLTLESLPAVIGEAQRQGVLVVFRHLD